MGLLVLFLIAQFFRPSKDNTQDIEEVHANIQSSLNVPDDVHSIMKKACYDCHSNHTDYPWYNHITPVNYWLKKHVDEGKEHLNFSEISSYSVKKRKHKFDEMVEEVKEEKMPLPSYTWMHGNAKLTEAERNALIAWAKANM